VPSLLVVLLAVVTEGCLVVSYFLQTNAGILLGTITSYKFCLSILFNFCKSFGTCAVLTWKSFSSEANYRSASYKLSCFLWHWKVYYCLHRKPRPVLSVT